MTIILSGHETTNLSTGWALYMLATHPHEQDLLREELVKAFPDKSNFNPTFDELNSLEYLNCVIKETLRLYPPGIDLKIFLFKNKRKELYYQLVIFILGNFVQRTSADDKVIEDYFIPKVRLLLISFILLKKKIR